MTESFNEGIFSLEGRVALVTGARSGIGQAVAVALAAAGASVVGVSRGESTETGRAIERQGGAYEGLQTDLGSLTPERASELVESVVAQHDGLDILVNNAGQIHRAPAVEVAADDWMRIIDLNLTSPFLLAQAFGRHALGRQSGPRAKVINIASLLSFQGGINTSAYTASKSGLLGMTRLLCNEWAAVGVNVNAIAPGYIATDATSALRADEERSRQILERIPAGRWGEPGDLGGATVFLASRASDYVNGIVLPVDGGWLAR